jgi:acetyl esterase/lipase
MGDKTMDAEEIAALVDAGYAVASLDYRLSPRGSPRSTSSPLTTSTAPTPVCRTRFQSHDAPDSPESRLMGAPIQTIPDAARAASPVTRVHPDAPPFLLAHGDRDGLVPAEHSRALHRALRVQGVPTTLLVLADANHEDPAFDTPPVLGAVSAFLRSTLLGDPAGVS